MVDSKVYKNWFDLAEEDYGFASANLADSDTQYFGLICFHFQQAAEKYFKTFIVAHDLKFEKIHDLGVLCQTCITKDNNFLSLEDDCNLLSDFYVESRYPVIIPSPKTREIASQAKESVERIREVVRNSLGL
ncbi:HEPN domain-containing protein [Candidatus Collierbacteria bacterium]|nr:HEPN domain-containing protein [Candidatus Collierbacteria bacterium]